MNKCEGCQSVCCVDFKITTEITDPLRVKRVLQNYLFIHRTGSDIVLGRSGHEVVVGIYNCDRFNKETNSCIHYNDVPRPDFCKNTGEKVIPNENCQLYKQVNLPVAV